MARAVAFGAAAVRDLLRPSGLLTLARIPLGILFVIFADHRAIALSLLALAALSDVLDGLVARARHETSITGEIADPLADKWFALAVLVGLLRGNAIEWPTALALSAREIGLLALFGYVLSRGGPSARVQALPLGKATTVAQFVAVVAIVAGWSGARVLVGVTAALGALAAAAYWDRERAAHRLRRRRNERARRAA